MCGRSLPPLSSVEQFEIRWHQTGCFSVHHVSDTRPSIRPYLTANYFLNMFSLLLFSKPWPAVWPRQRLETVRLQLLQAARTGLEELDWGQTWLRAGRSRPGVHYFSRWRAVRHGIAGLLALWPLDRVFHAGERNMVSHWAARSVV